MEYDCIYNSETDGERKVEINRRIKDTVCVLFEKEGIVLFADLLGNVSFCDLDFNLIVKDGAERNRLFNEVYVCREGDQVRARFAITKMIDHYPHCDGEYDRWSEVVVENIHMYCPIKQC